MQATVTAAAETRQHFDPIQSRHQAALHPPVIEGLVALQAAVHVHQHGFQRSQVETAQAVAQGVVVKRALGADPLLEIRVRQFAVQLLEAGEPKDKTMKERQKDAGRRDLRIDAGVGHLSGFGSMSCAGRIFLLSPLPHSLDGSGRHALMQSGMVASLATFLSMLGDIAQRPLRLAANVASFDELPGNPVPGVRRR